MDRFQSVPLLDQAAVERPGFRTTTLYRVADFHRFLLAGFVPALQSVLGFRF